MNRNVIFAVCLLIAWSASAGVAWQMTAREHVLAITNDVARLGASILTFLVMLGVSYFVLNTIYRRLGGSTSFLKWALAILNGVLRTK